MKKIFILLALFLMFGLLVGCASKPAQTIENNDLSPLNEIKVSEAEINDFWDQSYFTLGYGAKTYEIDYDYSKFDYDKILQLKLMKEEYYRIINLSEISSSDWLRFTRINWGAPSSKRDASDAMAQVDPNKEYRWDVWEADFLKDKKIENKNFTGKIINNSDEILEFLFLVRKPNHYYYLKVLPHSEKFYNIPATEDNVDYHISVMTSSVQINRHLVDIGKEYMDFGLSRYILNTYSLELTFDGEDDIKNYLDNTYTDNWKLVKRYDVNEPAPEEMALYSEKLNRFSGSNKNGK